MVAEIAFRKDGLMTPYTRLSSALGERVIGRIKFLASMRTYQESYPQDGRIDRHQVGAKQDIRVATYPTVTGEKLNLRLFAALRRNHCVNCDFRPGSAVSLSGYSISTPVCCY